MISAATLAAYILAIAQPVAAECERDRLHARGDFTTVVSESAMPKPSQAWADAWAAGVVADPLMPGDPKTEVVHGLVYAFGESTYRDRVVGDGGTSFCSLGVKASLFGTTGANLLDHPSECVRFARIAMRRSMRGLPEHPMALYAGGDNRAAIAIADARAARVKRLVASLPALPKDGAT